MHLTNEQNLLIFAISHQYILMNNDGEIDNDVARALCGTYNALKIEYKIPDLTRDLETLGNLRLIEKNFKEKRYDITLVAKGNPALTLYDEKSAIPSGKSTSKYDSFMKTFWVIFCSFLKVPLCQLLKDIHCSESKQLSDLNVISDIAASVLCDLAIKGGFVEKDPKGTVSLTEKGQEMLESQKEAVS